jgi:hypothetical protein
MPSLAHWGWALVFVFDGGDGFPLAHGRRRPGEQVRARAEVYLAEHYFVVAVESELHHQPPRPDAAPFLLRHEREALPVAQPPVRLHEHGPRASLRVPAPFPTVRALRWPSRDLVRTVEKKYQARSPLFATAEANLFVSSAGSAE